MRTAWQDGTISEKKAELKFTLKQLLPEEVFLSELDPLRLTAGWRQTEFNRNFNGGGLSIGGRHFEKGIGMPTNSEIEFELNGTYDNFNALWVLTQHNKARWSSLLSGRRQGTVRAGVEESRWR